MEQYFQNPAVRNNTSQDGISMAKWKSLSADGSADGISGGLDCNICLDLVQDPVVTFCGHLYCWPCIYKWLHFQTNPSQDPPQCPVCKAPLSEETLIPLYGRGLSTNPSEEKARQFGIVIPQRPLSPKCNPSSASPSPTISRAVPQLQQFGYLQQQPQFHNGPALSNSSHPTIEMLGEMVLARMFGYETGMYEYPSSYHVMGGTNPRIRRQVMQADKSLSRIINFLFCCMFLCLLLF